MNYGCTSDVLIKLFLLMTLLFLLILFIIYIYLDHGRTRKYIMKLQGPPAYPIIGNLLMFLVSSEQLWLLIRKLNKDYYPIFRLTSMHLSVVNIQHPDDAEVLLSSTTHIEKSALYDLLHPWFGTGLLTSAGSKWRHRRKILTPAFHFNVLKKYAEIISENSEKLIKSLHNKKESVQSLTPLITKYSLNVICEAAMGIKTTGKEDSQNKYREALHNLSDILVYRFTRPYLYPHWIFNNTQKGRQQKKLLKVLHEFTTQIINERKDYHDKTNEEFLKELISDDSNQQLVNEEVHGIRKRRLAMLDLMIAAYKHGQIDDPGIREEVDTFTFEGHDTSAMASCFIILLLAEHQDVQTKARAEINEVFNKSSGKVKMEDLQQLQYLERCIKESLRLYPSVPFISRSITEDLHLKNYLIPKGAIAHVHIYDLHRNPYIWPEPNKYDPDRFLPENSCNRHPFAFLPFSAGPRNCIGQKFAMMELKSLISHLLYHFYLEPIDLAHEVPITPDLVLRPARPIHVKFVPIR
ncbi:cytochrome P450 4C1-like [Copidosoma floridanum]|uniref:cytochrome P450 4C1-like n=1 Tax=Copidosoma floridanum TaxID=29053 RepID=UPI0006C9E309|nr:cytochrome P450 4C1-like [Copidosoma floridanum]